MIESLRELYKYRDLIYQFAWRDIKIKYKQSVMGILWAILMPVLIIAAGIMVKYAYAMIAKEPLNTRDLVGVAVKSLPWAFFVASIRFACNSLITNTSLVTKIYFPKEIFPLAAVISQLFDFVVASAALAVLLVFLQTGWSLYLLWTPVLLLTMVMLAAGIGMVVAAASLFFRDVKYIVEVVVTFGIFFTPVFYDVAIFGDKGRLLMLNPVSPLLEAFSATVARQQAPDLGWLAYSAACALVVTLGGYLFFKNLEPGFAESI